MTPRPSIRQEMITCLTPIQFSDSPNINNSCCFTSWIWWPPHPISEPLILNDNRACQSKENLIIKVQPLSFQITRCRGEGQAAERGIQAFLCWSRRPLAHPWWLMAPAAQPSPLFWCSKYTAGGFGGAPGFGGLEGVEVQDPSLPCVFSNSYTAPVLHSLPQPALSDKLQV